ncbi:MAG: hypothetical protein OER90_16760 [Gemmatimonadota bacterium]|nr:hypothetical protein [Gemmatimonadota bacterium]
MRRPSILATALVAVTLCGPLRAQQTDLPNRTLEQRFLRGSYLSVSTWVASIAYAKSMGQTPEDFGRWVGKLYAPSWSGLRGQGPQAVVRGMHRNFTTYDGAVMEIVEASESSITVRANRPYIGFYFGDDLQSRGVTVEEYEQVFQVMNEEICQYLELTCKQRVEEGWVVTTIAVKE